MARKKPKVNLQRPVPSQSGDLEKLFSSEEDVEQSTGMQLLSIRLEAIQPDPEQPRNTFPEETLQELADSIKQDGVIQPIEVTEIRPNQYMIVHGERRWRAAKMAGLEMMPAVVRRRDYDDVTRFVHQLVENIQREDLNDVDRAFGMVRLRDLMQEELNTQLEAGLVEGKPHSRTVTWSKVSERLGYTRQRVSQLIQLLDLPKEIKDAVRQGKISERDTRVLRGLKPSQQRALYRALDADDITGKEYKQVARYLKKEAPEQTVHEAIRVLNQPLPPQLPPSGPEPAKATDPPPVRTEPAAMALVDNPAAAEEDTAVSPQPDSAAHRVTGVQRLDWVRGHLARIPRQNLTPAERKEMLRLLYLIQQDVNSLLKTLEFDA